MATQAKCDKCGLRFDWQNLKPSRTAKFKIGSIQCPHCGTKLEKTSSMMKRYPTVHDLPLAEVGGAYRMTPGKHLQEGSTMRYVAEYEPVPKAPDAGA